MAYTQVWDAAYNNTPAGASQLSGGDDSIRALKRDIYERLIKILVDINADPPTLLATVLGTIGQATDRIMAFGPHILEARQDEDDTRHNDSDYQHMDSGLTSVGSLYLPHGITIKKLEAAMDKSLGADVSLELFKINYATGAKTVLDTVLRNVGGVGVSAGAIANPPGIGEVVDSNVYVYGVRFFAAGFILNQPRFYGMRLTVDVPNVLSAV